MDESYIEVTPTKFPPSLEQNMKMFLKWKIRSTNRYTMWVCSDCDMPFATASWKKATLKIAYDHHKAANVC